MLNLLLFYHHELSQEVNNPKLVHRLLFSDETRARLRDELDSMNPVVFNNLLTSLRKKGAISRDNKIKESLIPPIENGTFGLVFRFELEDEIDESGESGTEEDSL